MYLLTSGGRGCGCGCGFGRVVDGAGPLKQELIALPMVTPMTAVVAKIKDMPCERPTMLVWAGPVLFLPMPSIRMTQPEEGQGWGFLQILLEEETFVSPPKLGKSESR